MHQSRPRGSGKAEEIPVHLVYEIIDGIPVPYRDYRQVMKGDKNLESIMGYGGLQWLLVNIISDYFKRVFGKKYWVLGGDGGLHLSRNSNLAVDIGFYPRAALSLEKLQSKYLNEPPEIVIEIDTKADPAILEQMDYYHRKTQRLLDFGVLQVLWLYTDTRKVLDARPGRAWQTVNWSDELEIMGHSFTIENIIKEQD